ncbi:MAG: hypothetical protein CEN91_188 [Candidatus Berkelbacteria bacterium Licking1014_85]|uniref:PIN domain-containing protein n=1 Tax=Candidatus Berkelbacteria bacterium Licking1014_85 TaxID=2017148 RepID=A0A554LL63_9BACT|nr:MAG: hypothetical protein CEN91_188 [Candidatus Berkelbacteria bacterium Licking1014_85]
MNVVLDTNIIISALVFGGKPREIFELIVNGQINGFFSKKLLNELLGVLKIKFKYIDSELEKIKSLIKQNFIIINPKKIPKIITDDLFDNQVLAITDFEKIDFIISGDKHLLNIEKYKNTPIQNPESFLEIAIY